MYKILIFLILFHTTIIKSASLPGFGDFEWEFETNFQNGKFHINWNASDEEYLIMELIGPTKGYVAVGFSPNGAMKGSDIILGWVESDGQAFIKDMYAIGNEAPLEDDHNDVDLLFGEEIDSQTRIVFKRKWITCDEKQDFILNFDTIRMLWAYGDNDPSQGIDTQLYHGHHNRGMRLVHPRDFSLRLHTAFPDDKEKFPTTPNNVKFWDVVMDKVQVNDEDTTYFCTMWKPPFLETKHQMIGWRAVIEPENVDFIHHIILYECVVPDVLGGSAATFEKYLDHPGSRCYTENMPPEWGRFCMAVPIVWAIGGLEGMMYPPHLGIPLGEQHGGTTYFMLEMHYDNQMKKPFVDNSGLRIYVTDTPREHDLAALLVGQRYSPFNTIPKGVSTWRTRGLCSSECTKKEFPETGIKAVQVFAHGHVVLKGITLRVIRDGIEQEPIIKDSNYDFDFQQTRILGKEHLILPGDDIVLDCDTSTKDKNRTWFGGIQTREEMCISYVYYYPRMKLTECRTDLEYNNYFNGLGVKKVHADVLDRLGLPYKPEEGQLLDPVDVTIALQNETDRHMTYERNNIFDYVQIEEPKSLKGKSVGDILSETNWTEDEDAVAKKLNQKWMSGNYYAFCSHESRFRVPLKNWTTKMPKFVPWVSPEEKLCKSRAANKFERREPEKELKNSYKHSSHSSEKFKILK